ncbi:hypothetical protein APS56_05640 [Pseudalgibacter alginicilyticus]|uniref:DUF2851 domain-containing protein n=1 Tax=Pseudalgibacter alginicilyticus TaxID=1736674 RepID=A0A0P0CEU4_9FLAO|nr:DUF2851 family protein [Pseudalgibacter alginicilyticus]ALJ04647.1 hypothetical protein APS56_05640 [Pseudalgibacter alginicilyticus]
MQEDFLHYVWKYKKIDVSKIKTTTGEAISVVSVGEHNLNSGPDFFNAQLKIGKQLWAGNVEIHIKSSDWFLHNHEKDANYDNVILHVVWEHDIDIYRKDNSVIPVLELKHFMSTKALNNYEKLFSKSQKWINCEEDFMSVDDFKVQNWLERLYFERLERKSQNIEQLLKDSKNDWEAVLFKMLSKNFGLKVNGDAFLSMACSFDFSVVRKTQSNSRILEALLFGQSGLLEKPIQDGYYSKLVKDYQFLSQKFKLSNKNVLPIQFFRLRPPNFPTIRLSQLANFYHQNQNSFSKIMEIQSLEAFYDLFSLGTSAFWESHYTFEKVSKPSKKTITKSFVDLLLINTIIPLKFSYAKHHGKSVDDVIVDFIQQIASEKNAIVEKFNALKKTSNSALQSQGLIQLKHYYCDKNKCLKCAIGNSLLNK